MIIGKSAVGPLLLQGQPHRQPVHHRLIGLAVGGGGVRVQPQLRVGGEHLCRPVQGLAAQGRGHGEGRRETQYRRQHRHGHPAHDAAGGPACCLPVPAAEAPAKGLHAALLQGRGQGRLRVLLQRPAQLPGLQVLLPGHLFHQQNKQGLLPGLLTVVHIASTSFRRFRFPGNPSI